MLDYEGLARASPTPKERLSRSRPCKNGFRKSDEGVRTPFRNDLIEAMDEGDDLGRDVAVPYGYVAACCFLNCCRW